MIYLKFIADIACGVLFWWGGYDFLVARRYIMPTVIAIMLSLATHTWWVGLMALPVMGTLCLGYSGSHWAWRGGWMAMQATVIGLGVTITHHLMWYFYLPYMAIAFGAGALLYDIEPIISDPIFGCWLGAVIFLVR